MARPTASHLAGCSNERAPSRQATTGFQVRFGCHVSFLLTFYIATCSKLVYCSEILPVDWKCLAFSIRTSSFMVSTFGVSTYLMKHVDSCVVFSALHLEPSRLISSPLSEGTHPPNPLWLHRSLQSFQF